MRIIRIPGLHLSFATSIQLQRLKLMALPSFLGFLGFGFHDTAVGIVNIVREIPIVDTLGNPLPGGSLIILVQPVLAGLLTVSMCVCLLHL